jgi:hypothetical protein
MVLDLGRAEGEIKIPPAKERSEGLRKTFWETQQLFSSFLRGASCPKSPRHAATAAISFMLENEGVVKGESREAGGKFAATTYRRDFASNV